jgi:hypothetical protein
MRLFIYLKKCAFFVAFLAPLHPQFIPGPALWTDQGNLLSWTTTIGLTKSAYNYRLTTPAGNVIRTITLPPDASSFDYFNNSAYVLSEKTEKVQEDGRNITRLTYTLYKEVNRKWVIDAFLTGKNVTLSAILPLKNEKYLLLLNRPGVNGHLFMIGKKNTANQIQLDQIIDSVFEKPVFTYNTAHQRFEQNYYFGRELINYTTIRSAGKIVVIIDNVGLFVIFNEETGRFERKVSLFKEITEEFLEKKTPFANPQLTAQPTNKGTIICVTREKNFVLFAENLFPYPKFGKADMDEATSSLTNFRSMQEKNNAITLARNIRWPMWSYWEFDPLTGKIISIPAPSKMPEKISNPPPEWGLLWGMQPDGEPALLDNFGNFIEDTSLLRRILNVFEVK